MPTYTNAVGGVQSKPSGLLTRPAARDLSAYQYHAMKIDTDGNIDYVNTSATGATDKAIGILQNAPSAAGQEAEVATEGTSLFYAGTSSGTFDEMAYLGSNSAYKATLVTASGEKYFCTANEAVSATGDLIEVTLVGPQVI